MIGAALHLRDEVTQPDACPWRDSLEEKTRPHGDTLPVSSGIGNGRGATATTVSPVAVTSRLTRAQAMYAVLWLGVDARELRGWL